MSRQQLCKPEINQGAIQSVPTLMTLFILSAFKDQLVPFPPGIGQGGQN